MKKLYALIALLLGITSLVVAFYIYQQGYFVGRKTIFNALSSIGFISLFFSFFIFKYKDKDE
jgi:hypothetical protein